MKSVLVFIIALTVTFSSLNAVAFEKSAKYKNMKVLYSAEKPLVVGVNRVNINVTKNGVTVDGAEVKIKIFMPEMPGMPYMEDVAIAEAVGSSNYRATVTFSMSGTWQVHIFVTTKDGKKYRIKSSVNL